MSQRRMRKTFDRRMLSGRMDDGGQSCQKMIEANGKKVREEVGRRFSRDTVVYRHLIRESIGSQ